MATGKINIYEGKDLEGVRAAAQASAYVLDRTAQVVVPGMSTADIDMLAAEFIKETGGKSCFLGYNGYPAHICVSINNEVVHGIGRPDRFVQPGDLVSLDVGVTIGGYCGDNARTVCAGPCSELGQRLMDTTKEALEAGIEQAVEGNTINDIGSAVEHVARRAGFSVVRDMVGHGCGRRMHEPPEVPNYFIRGNSPVLKEGMILAIEPMVNVGTWRIVIDRVDGWTTRTADSSLSAHFEHQVLVKKHKAEVLTCLNNQKTVSR
jgi:methionyl aminopeptidase